MMWDIAAAFVGALLAVSLGESVSRVSMRRRDIEQAWHRLMVDIPHVVARFMAPITPELPIYEPGSEWDLRRERVLSDLVLVSASAKWPMRNHEAIRKEANDLSARLAALLVRRWDGERLTPTEALEIGTRGLGIAIFGQQGTAIADLTNRYVEKGFSERLDHQAARRRDSAR